MAYNDEENSQLKNATIALNEMFLTLIESGFQEQQALRLIAFLIEDMSMEDDD